MRSLGYYFGIPEINGLAQRHSALYRQFRNMSNPTDVGPLSKLTLVHTTADAGLRVRAVRKHQGLRIDDSAALCGVSVDLLSRLENGAGSVRLDKLLDVLKGLGLQLIIAPSSAELAITNGDHDEQDQAAP